MFSFQSLPRRELELPGLQVACCRWTMARPNSTSRLMSTKLATASNVSSSTAPIFFDLAAVQRMAGHWQVLLSAALANPDHPLDSLTMLPESERRQLLVNESDRRGVSS